MGKIIDLFKAFGFIVLAMIGFVVAPIAGAVISVALCIWLMFMVINQERTKDD